MRFFFLCIKQAIMSSINQLCFVLWGLQRASLKNVKSFFFIGSWYMHIEWKYLNITYFCRRAEAGLQAEALAKVNSFAVDTCFCVLRRSNHDRRCNKIWFRLLICLEQPCQSICPLQPCLDLWWWFSMGIILYVSNGGNEWCPPPGLTTVYASPTWI